MGLKVSYLQWRRPPNFLAECNLVVLLLDEVSFIRNKLVRSAWQAELMKELVQRPFQQYCKRHFENKNACRSVLNTKHYFTQPSLRDQKPKEEKQRPIDIPSPPNDDITGRKQASNSKIVPISP